MKTKQKKHICMAREAEGEQCFWVHEGPILKNLCDFKESLKNMSVKQFNYHSKRDGNDFAKWVENVLQCPECAALLKKARTKKSAFTAVSQCC